MIDENYYKNLPRKRMGAGALFFNNKNELLIVKPTYKDHWSVPGGSVDENESPRKACIREIKEEIGLDIRTIKFFCVDYIKHKTKGESLQFTFYGGVLTPDQIKKIKIPQDEISEYKFLEVKNALELVSESLKKRALKCLEALQNDTAIYLEEDLGGE